ncbi:unnamed protein product [Auanema sp. JU1783]|nr:unnamed protein product [Auanema sp. JU1783]
MGLFRRAFMSAIGVPDHEKIAEEQRKGTYTWKKEHLTKDQLSRTSDNADRYSGIPAIPTDIAYQSGKEISGKKQSGVTSNITGNPFVIVGMGLTTAALLGMFKSSFLGDKLGAQKYMQYRIMAQFFTVTALVAGVTIFGSTYEEETVKKSVPQ